MRQLILNESKARASSSLKSLKVVICKLALETMQSGADVIYQTVFFAPPQAKIGLRGDADFLIKCDTPSSLGDFSYEVLDTRLVRTAKPKHIMQFCVYSEPLTDPQGLYPADMHLFLGDHAKHSVHMTDFFLLLHPRQRPA